VGFEDDSPLQFQSYLSTTQAHLLTVITDPGDKQKYKTVPAAQCRTEDENSME
jgi:hypothetical protein